MGTNNLFFLENIEWFDETGKELVHRIPEVGSGEIKYGAQLTVRESQAAVFFYKGRAHDALGPGRHTLRTGNLPVLTKILSAPWAFNSPLRAEVYLVNTKTFTDLSWGTRDPVAFKDSELGLIRLRAFGNFNIRVVQPVLFINRLVGTQGVFTTEDIEQYLARVVVSRFNDYMGENLDSLLNLPARYDELSEGLQKKLAEDFSQFGLSLTNLYIQSITPPPEVQKAMDAKSSLSLFGDLDRLVKLKAAMAMEKAAEQSGGETGAGLGLGIGMVLPSLVGGALVKGDAPKVQEQCPECKNPVEAGARFCPHCGHQIVVFQKCLECGKNLAMNARFCSRCGKPVAPKPQESQCPACGTKNLSDSKFCNQCGEKLESDH
ncbi:MAG: SPFH domain-containing protein [Thermodesulfobacteriota bacterium]